MWNAEILTLLGRYSALSFTISKLHIAALALIQECGVGVASSFCYSDGFCAVAGDFTGVMGIRGDDEVYACITC